MLLLGIEKTLKTFVINLDRSPDRWAKISEHLTNEGFDFERMPAVDGLRIENPSAHARSLSLLILQRRLSGHEIGCYLSHVKVWRKIVEEKIPVALVLEDDAVPIPGCKKAIDNIDPSAIGLHMIRLHVLNQKKVESRGQLRATRVKLNGLDIFLQVGVVWSSTAYLITRAGAERLLKGGQRARCPVDWFTFSFMFDGLRHAICRPFLFSSDPSLETTVQTKNEIFWPNRILQYPVRFFVKRFFVPFVDLVLLYRYRAAVRSIQKSRP